MIDKCQPNSSVREICEFGDSLLLNETNKVFKKEKELKKGIAFPTCVSVNNCICHFSPIPKDPDVILKDGDLVKMYVTLFLFLFFSLYIFKDKTRFYLQ